LERRTEYTELGRKEGRKEGVKEELRLEKEGQIGM
jgi:hypothetical protein